MSLGPFLKDSIFLMFLIGFPIDQIVCITNK